MINKLNTVFKNLFSPSEKQIAIKTNEIIDYLNDNLIATKIYKATITQSGTDNITSVEHINTIGDISFVYNGEGNYAIVSDSKFTIGKTMIDWTYGGPNGNGVVQYQKTSITTITLLTGVLEPVNNYFSAADSIISSGLDITIEVFE